MESNNTLINSETLRQLNPCSDRFNNWKKYYKHTNCTIIEFLSLDKITFNDKMWVLTQVLDSKILNEFRTRCLFRVVGYRESGYRVYADYVLANINDLSIKVTSNYAAHAAADNKETEERLQINDLIDLIKKEVL